jgi:hypothetical protein
VTWRAVSCIAFAGAALVAHAQQQPPPAPAAPGVRPVLPAPVTQPLPPARWTPQQIREAFQLADVDGDGQLSRAEAQRLAILPKSFEDTDVNKDGALTLDEYAASFGP